MIRRQIKVEKLGEKGREYSRQQRKVHFEKNHRGKRQKAAMEERKAWGGREENLRVNHALSSIEHV